MAATMGKQNTNGNLFYFRNWLFIKFSLIIILCIIIGSYVWALESQQFSGTNNDDADLNAEAIRDTRSLPPRKSNQNHHEHIELLMNNSIPADQIRGRELLDHLYGKTGPSDESTRQEQIVQMSSWLSNEDGMVIAHISTDDNHDTDIPQTESTDEQIIKLSGNGQSQVKGYVGKAEALKSDSQKTLQQKHLQNHRMQSSSKSQILSSSTQPQLNAEESEDIGNSDGNYDAPEEDIGLSGTTKTPPCADYGRYYCTYKEDYPIKVVTEVTKYYKWPLEKLFRDLRLQVMPSLANDQHGGLVCDSITRIVRPGWSKNTNGRWLVVINTDYFQQYITEVICRHGTGSYCNFIPPCYHASCRQRYNTQKLLVIDPWNPYKGPFLSEFLFPSCCICYVPGGGSDVYSSSTVLKEKIIGSVSASQSSSDKSPSAAPSSSTTL